MKNRKPDNPRLLELIRFLQKMSSENNAKIWNAIADFLSKPRGMRVSTNLSCISRHSEKGDVVAVPGKVLGSGSISHPVTVAAFSFTPAARKKIRRAKGKCLTLSELVKKNPRGSKVRIVV